MHGDIHLEAVTLFGGHDKCLSGSIKILRRGVCNARFNALTQSRGYINTLGDELDVHGISFHQDRRAKTITARLGADPDRAECAAAAPLYGTNGNPRYL